MTSMAAGAAAFASIQVYSADTHIWPSLGIQNAVFLFYNSSMTVKTAGRPFKIAVHSLIEPWIDFPYKFQRVGMFAHAVLLGFIRMASGAVFGRHNFRYRHPVLFGPVFQI